METAHDNWKIPEIQFSLGDGKYEYSGLYRCDQTVYNKILSETKILIHLLDY